MSLLRVYDGLDAARKTILASRRFGEVELPEGVRARIRAVFGADLTAEQVVARVIADVRADGDEALRRYGEAFDSVAVDTFRVDDAALDAAVASAPPALVEALEVAARRVRAFHERARRQSWLDFRGEGALGQLILPLDRVGVYAPGGRAAYPSSVVMAVVPARVAGVREIVVATPPRADGTVTPSVLVAARVAEADAVYRVGGAQAIAALAYGTAQIPRVDKIVGPGNIFVVLAKRAVYGVVGTDGLPGPTETIVLADDSAEPRALAADLLAQAEHDPLAQSILLCTSRAWAGRVQAELAELLARAPRREVASQAFAARGGVVLVDSVAEALAFANEYAPEHLCLCVREPWQYLGLVRNAGGVFVGERSVEALGDYTAGPSHIMPTSGAARFASPVGIDDFVKVTSVFAFGPNDLATLGPPAIALAEAEGLEAHAQAIRLRLDSEQARQG
ncbi:MAG TPA: histidinol dehydrogenase [Chloroflexota bacterium]|nr:histidinol dehydrogenase [Chloroflexota bacterium]